MSLITNSIGYKNLKFGKANVRLDKVLFENSNSNRYPVLEGSRRLKPSCALFKKNYDWGRGGY